MTDVFKASDISVYASDGSDVRADYVSLDFGKSSQWREMDQRLRLPRTRQA